MQPSDGTETLVIDCSLTMAWYFKDEATPYTSGVRASLATGRAVAPSVWPLEVANVLLMSERRKGSNPTGLASRTVTGSPVTTPPTWTWPCDGDSRLLASIAT